MAVAPIGRNVRIYDVSESLELVRSFFATNKDSGELAKRIQSRDYFDRIAWEQVSVCQESPGPVRDEEILLRQIVNPVHFDLDSDEIKPNLFEDIVSRGASTHRKQHTTDEKILDIARERVELQNKNPPRTGIRTLIGHVSLSVSVVRMMSVDVETLREKRLLAIYDTANEKDPSHADICLLHRQKQVELSVKSQLTLRKTEMD